MFFKSVYLVLNIYRPDDAFTYIKVKVYQNLKYCYLLVFKGHTFMMSIYETPPFEKMNQRLIV